MRPHFAPCLALLLGLGAWAGLPASLAQQPQLLDQPKKVAYDPHRGVIQVLCAHDQVRFFDAFLREIPAPPGAVVWPLHSVEATSIGLLALEVWSGRRLSIDPEAGTMALAGSPWEDPPLLTWGPGWALVEWRTADPQIGLEWRRVGEDTVTYQVARCDRWDGLRRRAWLEGLHAGERILLRYRPSGRYFPPRDWTRWQEFVVPLVDPAGARPSAELPRE